MLLRFKFEVAPLRVLNRKFIRQSLVRLFVDDHSWDALSVDAVEQHVMPFLKMLKRLIVVVKGPVGLRLVLVRERYVLPGRPNEYEVVSSYEADEGL